MSTCPPNLTHSFLTLYKIITFKVDEKVLILVPKGNRRAFEAKKAIIWSIYGLKDFISLFLVELGTCLQNLILTRGVEH
jgi:hypothetical protein